MERNRRRSWRRATCRSSTPPPCGPCSAAVDAADDAVDVVVATTGRLEPMLAWWSHRASAPLLDRWADGVRALHEAIATLGARTVAVDPAVMRNVNTVADLTGDVRDR